MLRNSRSVLPNLIIFYLLYTDTFDVVKKMLFNRCCNRGAFTSFETLLKFTSSVVQKVQKLYYGIEIKPCLDLIEREDSLFNREFSFFLEPSVLYLTFTQTVVNFLFC